MQIDFHHTATYVIARMAGFSHEQADIIAYSAQYIDDSVSSGFIEFGDTKRYQRFATAHPPSDFQNATNNNENSQSWQLFHFLPGNLGLNNDENLTNVSYEERLICKPDSYVAKEMMKSVIEHKNKPWSLHRLGISAHIFVDTFAHQEFIGLNHKFNYIQDIYDSNGNELKKLSLPPVGHGQANTYPDRPFLNWSYIKTYNGEKINRNNIEIFMNASIRLYEEFKKFILENYENKVESMSENNRKILFEMFSNITSLKEEERHQEWIDSIENNKFGFGSIKIHYDKDTWKKEAIGESFFNTIKEKMDQIGLDYVIEVEDANKFINSNYKNFHDAAREHRNCMLTEIFPKFKLYIG